MLLFSATNAEFACDVSRQGADAGQSLSLASADPKVRARLSSVGQVLPGIDLEIRGGENIAPAEIEEVLLRPPDVIDVAVIGVPDEEWGQRIEAVVVVRSGFAIHEGDLHECVKETLWSSKTPNRFIFWPELPRTETGKLVRLRVLAKVLEAEVLEAEELEAEEPVAG